MKKATIIKAEAEYTGGGIWVFVGELSDGTFFMADGFEFDVRILNEFPSIDDEDVWYPEWQEAHLVRDLNTETEGPGFILDIIKWLRANGEDFIDSDYIEEDAKEKVGKKGWR